MLVSCQGLELSDALLRVSKAISSKITNPILEGIKIVAEDDTLILSATDIRFHLILHTFWLSMAREHSFQKNQRRKLK